MPFFFDGVWKGMWSGNESTEITIVGNKAVQYIYKAERGAGNYRSKVVERTFEFGNDHMTITMSLIGPDRAVAHYRNVKGQSATATLTRQ